MKKIRVSAAIIHREEKILATQRGYGSYKGYWEFPGGKRELGESGEETIVREIKEELQIDIGVEKFLFTIEHQYPDFYIVMDLYLCSILEGEVSLLEHEALKWLDMFSLDSVDWLEADKKVIEKLKTSIDTIFK